MIKIQIETVERGDDQITISLADGRKWNRQFPPEPGTLERLQQKVDEIGPDVVALTLLAVGGNVALLAGAEIIGDFEQPLAMVQVKVGQ